MGMFDSVFAPCVGCGVELEFQSKAGECQLRRYRFDNVPAEVARDLQDEMRVCACGTKNALLVPDGIPRVAMRVVKLVAPRYEGDDEDRPEWD